MENYYTGMEGQQNPPPMDKPHRKGRGKRILIILACLLILLVFAAGGAAISKSMVRRIDIITISGTIADYGSDPFSVPEYDHQFILSSIDRLMRDSTNEAILLSIDSPGGGVYETDEVYLKLMEYKETTNRPIYASFGAQAASGGYYLAMASDKIYSNRNCMTGSIGVRLNTMIDMTGLMEKLGIKCENITAGKNKAMGDPYSTLTPEQRGILQAYVDDSYEQFVDIVVSGRPNLSEGQIRTLADGRIYSARQALDAGLVDEIGTLDDALSGLQSDYGLENCAVEYVTQDTSYSLFQLFFSALADLRPKNEVESLIDVRQALQGQSGYYCAAPLR